MLKSLLEVYGPHAEKKITSRADFLDQENAFVL